MTHLRALEDDNAPPSEWAELLEGWEPIREIASGGWAWARGGGHIASAITRGRTVTVLRNIDDAIPAGTYTLEQLRDVLGVAAAHDGDDAPGAPAYVDVAEILDGHHRAPVTTRGGRRDDGTPLLYAAAVNILFGAPEAGKTLAAGAMAAHELAAGGRILWIDLDHNGAPALLARLQGLGATRDELADRTRFRLAVPEDSESVMNVLQDSVDWAPTLVVVDSIGELLPMFGAKSNDSDEYTGVHRRVLAATARLTGAAVLAIDHEAKSVESRNYGSAGTMAKKRAVDGAMLRVVNVAPFTPGVGGEAQLAIVKDRHGALRAIAQGSREPTVARFILTGPEHAMNVLFASPVKPAVFEQPIEDVDALLALTPPPRSVRDVMQRMSWGRPRSQEALRAYRLLDDNPADRLYREDDS